jgi:hypothetical protein
VYKCGTKLMAKATNESMTNIHDRSHKPLNNLSALLNEYIVAQIAVERKNTELANMSADVNIVEEQ